MLINIAGVDSNSELIPPPDDAQIQPNAVDLRVDYIYEMSGRFTLSDNHKESRSTRPHEPIAKWDATMGVDVYSWILQPGAYEVQFAGKIQIAEDEAGWVISRSSLIRNGCILTSGLYDSGYEGHIGGVLYVSGGEFLLEKDTRLGQFLTVKAESLHQYNGSYGTGSEHDKKYSG